MFKALLFLALAALAPVAQADDLAPASPVGAYGVHLYFDEREFIDVLSLFEYNGRLVGVMSVPNDFEGSVTNLDVDGDRISFNLLVPKNPSRPQDLVFYYEGRFFDRNRQQLIGYVRLKGERDFVASFVGFRRKAE